MFDFNDFLRKLDMNPAQIRLLRHDQRGAAAWRRGGALAFGCFASFQTRENSPYRGTDVVCHFLPAPSLPDGDATALFLGTTRITDRWDWDEVRMPALLDPDVIQTEFGRQNLEAFDLEWLEAGQEYAERILIRWGTGTRAWSQWANKQPKEILELRLHAKEPAFPGFSEIRARISDIPTFPQSWIGALESVRGIYLLVTDQGEQYVGSASGADGFMGRWRSYLANGHGGNVLLREGRHRDYTVSVLEIASPDMATADIIARETFWKQKLGARAHGLNAN
ncbi:GIY-YIG nuclease family protein [Roseobacter sp. MH60115]|uniref:GIY-YIG nuclease family protein n=1 Tax=Roseobacter sp. MH60115 TaxID=2785324 RepID=UPI0018A2B536|nr:GIY-YIG nuclease family protein [Roseobacter sp. MH60115]